MLGVAVIIRSYGQQIHDQLAEIIVFLLKTACANSTRKSYAVGQRHWATFQRLHKFTNHEYANQRKVDLFFVYPPNEKLGINSPCGSHCLSSLFTFIIGINIFHQPPPTRESYFSQ